MGYHRGYSPSAATRAKMRASAIGRKLTQEHKEKIRATKLGTVVSNETREKIRQSMKTRWRELGHAGKKKMPVPTNLRGYAQKLRKSGIKGQQFAQAIEAACE